MDDDGARADGAAAGVDAAAKRFCDGEATGCRPRPEFEDAARAFVGLGTGLGNEPKLEVRTTEVAEALELTALDDRDELEAAAAGGVRELTPRSPPSPFSSSSTSMASDDESASNGFGEGARASFGTAEPLLAASVVVVVRLRFALPSSMTSGAAASTSTGAEVHSNVRGRFDAGARNGPARLIAASRVSRACCRFSSGLNEGT